MLVTNVPLPPVTIPQVCFMVILWKGEGQLLLYGVLSLQYTLFLHVWVQRHHETQLRDQEPSLCFQASKILALTGPTSQIVSPFFLWWTAVEPHWSWIYPGPLRCLVILLSPVWHWLQPRGQQECLSGWPQVGPWYYVRRHVSFDSHNYT